MFTDAIFYKHLRPPTESRWTEVRIVLWNGGGIRVSLNQGMSAFKWDWNDRHILKTLLSGRVVLTPSASNQTKQKTPVIEGCLD